MIAVSTDTEFAHLAWRREEKELEGVEFPMGADTAGKLGRLFGINDPDSGLNSRGTFIINPHGILLNSEVNPDNMGRNIDELMRKFKANLYLAKNTQEMTPSKWKEEGDKTLRPGPKVVGRVHEAFLAQDGVLDFFQSSE